MTQTGWVTLLLKIFLITGFVANAAWVALYSRLARWWGNPVGRTLVIEAALIGVLLVPTTMSLFFNLNRLTSEVTAWIDVGLIGLITPVMGWRCVVWLRLHKYGQAGDGGSDDAPAG